MAGYITLEIDQYANFSSIIILKNPDNSRLNLTNYTANSQIRKSFYTTSSNTITATISDASNGEILLSMTSANTSNLTPGRYVFDVVTTTGGGVSQRIVEGVVVVNPGVTR